MVKSALLVVDAQRGIFEEGPWRGDLLLDSLKVAISQARHHQIPVLFVRHNDQAGEPLESNTHGWQIHEALEVLPQDVVIDKWYNSAFKKTPLQAHLASLGVEHLIVMGLQTEYCIDATIKSAFDLGYHLLVPEEGHSTLDNPLVSAQTLHRLYSERIWPYAFAEVVPLKAILAVMGRQ